MGSQGEQAIWFNGTNTICPRSLWACLCDFHQREWRCLRREKAAGHREISHVEQKSIVRKGRAVFQPLPGERRPLIIGSTRERLWNRWRETVHTPSLGRLSLNNRILELICSILLNRAAQTPCCRGSSAVLTMCGIESFTVAIVLKLGTRREKRLGFRIRRFERQVFLARLRAREG